MRIDQNLPVSEAAQSERLSGTNGQASSTPKTSGTQPQSDVTGSQQLRAKLEQTPEIRQDRVAALKKAMQDGTYKVSNQDLANAVFNGAMQKTKS